MPLMKKRFQPLEAHRIALIVLFAIVGACYLGWRLTIFNREALVFSSLVYAAELYGFVCLLLHVFTAWRLARERRKPAPDKASVDFFVCADQQSLATIRRTLLAAGNVAHPHRLWLLDQDARNELRQLAAEIACEYLAAKPESSKSALLNQALALSDAEFVAVLDADHAPQKEFLRHTLGYFRDDAVAFVQTSHDIYSPGSTQQRWTRENRIVWSEHALFHRILQLGKDYGQAALYEGSSAIFRRSAIEAIGGFAIGTEAEALHTSLRLHQRGFQSIYHSESLATSLAPMSLAELLKAKMRFCKGAMQVWRRERIVFNRHLTAVQRLHYLATLLTSLNGWLKAVFYAAPVVIVASGKLPVSGIALDSALLIATFHLLGLRVHEEVSRGYGRPLLTAQYEIARFATSFAVVLGLIGSRLGVRKSTVLGWSKLYLAPASLVMVGNITALIAAAIPLAGGDAGLSDAATAAIAWGGVNALLAAGLVLFAGRREKHEFADSGLAIPLPARIRSAQGDYVYGTVDDVSSEGFDFYGQLREPEPGRRIAGEIFLPTGTVKFNAKVKSLVHHSKGNQIYVKAIGCAFNWADPRQQDKLSQFLYGPSLQRQLHALREKVRTPLDSLTGIFTGEKDEVDFDPARWATIVFNLDTDQGAPSTGLISVARDHDRTRRLLSYEPLAEHKNLEVRVVTRSRGLRVSGAVRFVERIDNPVTPIYLYRFVPLAPARKTRFELTQVLASAS